jgi:hypothetical protein
MSLCGRRAGLDAVGKKTFLILVGVESRPLCRPAQSMSLYRLRYPCSLSKIKCNFLHSLRQISDITSVRPPLVPSQSLYVCRLQSYHYPTQWSLDSESIANRFTIPLSMGLMNSKGYGRKTTRLTLRFRSVLARTNWRLSWNFTSIQLTQSPRIKPEPAE